MRGWVGVSLAVLGVVAPARADEANATPSAAASAPVTAPVPATAPAAAPTPTPTIQTAIPEPSPAPYNRVAIQLEDAIGLSGPFNNVLLGGRFDRCFTVHTCMGGYLGYANLKGQSGRANNVLIYAMVEHHRPLGDAWHVPLRVAAGYLPNNGPFLRFSGGLSVAVGKVDVTFDLVAPTVWVTRNDPVVSMDLAAEAALRF